MRKILAVAAALALAAAVPAFAATTATDQVGVAYNTTDEIVMLGMVDNNLVEIHLDGGTFGANVAGARATLGSGAGLAEATGGYLLYTLHGTGSHKITVEKDASTAAGYAGNSLSVRIEAIQAGGSAVGTLGTRAGGASPTYVGIDGSADNLITGIAGSDTWTGVADYDGAQVGYRLSEDPVVSDVVVLYTIVSE